MKEEIINAYVMWVLGLTVTSYLAVALDQVHFLALNLVVFMLTAISMLVVYE